MRGGEQGIALAGADSAAAAVELTSMTPSMVFDSGAISPADSEEIVH